MALYRLIRNLAIGNRIIEKGTMARLETLKQETLDILISTGAISPVLPPPLDALPGWRLKSRRLKTLGIENALQLMEADKIDLAKRMNVKAETIEAWQIDVQKWLTPDPNRG